MKRNRLFFFLLLITAGCHQRPQPASTNQKAISCESGIPSRFAAASPSSPGSSSFSSPSPSSFALSPGSSALAAHPGMAWIPGGAFQMGADNKAQPDEYPKHTVTVAGFWIDKTEVTNAQFAAFVKATGYITTAEKTPDWDQLKKQLPPGAAKPDENLLVAASLVFIPPDHPISLDDYSQWWAWKKGASWKHPQGPGSDLNGKANYPVVHISWYDAAAYCKWAGKTLPTEADHYYHTAPVASFDPNGYGLYDMAGNVWEWCADYYNNTYYDQSNNSTSPRGPLKSYDPDEPFATKRVIRGGSFLCNDSYCSGYRVSRRMKSTEDSGLEHLGFRCVTHR